MALILDTGVIFASIDRDAARHRECRDLIGEATLDHRHFAVIRPRHVDASELAPA